MNLFNHSNIKYSMKKKDIYFLMDGIFLLNYKCVFRERH